MESLLPLVLLICLCFSEAKSIAINTDEFKDATPLIYPLSSSFKLNSAEIRTENSKNVSNDGIEASNLVNPSKRKVKALGTLAFLAGLGVGGLATAASSNVKSYAKLPDGSMTVKFGSSKLGPYLALYYDPSSILPSSYLYQNPFAFLPLVNPSKLQANGDSTIGISNRPGQDNLLAHIFALLNDKRPIDSINREDDVYAEEQTKSKTKSENIAIYPMEKTNELDAASGTSTSTCEKPMKDSRKNVEKKPSDTSDVEDLQENADAPLTSWQVQGDDEYFGNRQNRNVTEIVAPANGAGKEHAAHHRPHATHRPTSNHTKAPLTITNATTSNENDTTYLPPPSGYYGGSPQDIAHVDLTSHLDTWKYHEYNPVSYDLPYDKPANFYPEFYSAPPRNSYPSDQFFNPPSHHIPEYSNNDFDRFAYTSEGRPSYVNSGFKPVNN